MEKSLSDIVGCVKTFVEEMMLRVENLGVHVNNKEIDHVGYSCDTLEEYKDICRQLLCGHGSLLVEGIINGRPISTFALNSPIVLRDISIPCIEIAAPKQGSNYKDGLQHFEYVIGCKEDGVFDSAPLLQQFMSQNPDVTFQTRALNQHLNADVSVEFDDRTCVKFHARPLSEVIAYEIEEGHVTIVPAELSFIQNVTM